MLRTEARPEPSFYHVVSLVALLVLVQTPADLSAWSDLLTDYAKTEQACLVVDIDATRRPGRYVIDGPSGEIGLDRLGVALGRSWVNVDGAYVFRRRAETGDLISKSARRHTLDLLRPMGVLDLDAMRRGTFALTSLSGEQQRSVRHVVSSLGDGVGDSMVAQYHDRIRMRLVLETTLTAQGRTSQGTAVLELPIEGQTTQGTDPVRTVESYPPLIAPTEGGLDFGTGTIMTLRDIALRARATLDVSMEYDGRLGNSLYFVSGRFTARRLVSAFSTVLDTADVRIVEPADSEGITTFANSLKEIVFGPYRSDQLGFAGLKVGDALDAKKRTFLAAFGEQPPQRIRAFMYEHRLEPTDEFVLSAGLALHFSAPGMATLVTGDSPPFSYSVPHFVKIAL